MLTAKEQARINAFSDAVGNAVTRPAGGKTWTSDETAGLVSVLLTYAAAVTGRTFGKSKNQAKRAAEAALKAIVDTLGLVEGDPSRN